MKSKTLAYVCLVVSFATSSSYAQNCETAVVEAQHLYELGQNLEVIELLEKCLPAAIPKLERVQAYRLLALAYTAEDYPELAKLTVDKLIGLEGRFEPDYSEDPQKFIELVDESKAVHSKRSRIKRWILMGGGTLVTGIITGLIITSGGNRLGDLPAPPPLPPDSL